MPKLWLFGHDLDLAAPQPIMLGQLSVHATLNVAMSSLKLVLNGTCDIASFDKLTYVATVTVAGDRVSLPVGNIPAASGTLVILLGIARTYAKPVAHWVNGPEGLGIVTPDPLGLGAARTIRDDAFQLVSTWWEGNWQRSIITLSASTTGDSTVAIRPFKAGDVGLALDDHFAQDGYGGAVPELRVQQWLPLTGLSSQAGRLTVSFAPSEAVQAILLHPDILDSRSLVAGDGNALLYQFALAGGTLAADLSWGGAWQSADHRFDGRDGRPAQLVALTMRDERGHPLVFEADTFALTQRHGTNVADKTAGDAGWDQTNPALVLGDRKGWTASASLCAIDPIAIYGRKRLVPARDKDGFIAEPPYWIESGRAPLLDQAPAAIHGFARNVALKRNGNGAAGALTCQLVVEPVFDPIGDHCFSRASVAIASGQHDLEALFPEQSVYAQPDRKAMPVSARRRAAKGKPGGTITLPLIDTGWSLANLAGVPSGGTWSAVGNGWLATAGANWAGALNADLCAAFDDPGNPGYIHVQGHRGAPPGVTFETVLAKPPATTREGGRVAAGATAVREPVVRSWQAAPAAAAGPLMLAVQPEPHRLLFGGIDATIENRFKLDEANAAQIAGPANQFLRHWCGLDIPTGVADDLWLRSLRLLRDILGGEVTPIDIGVDDIDRELAAGVVYDRVQRFAANLAGMDVAPEFGFDLIALRVADMTPEDFILFWNEAIDPDQDGSFDRTLIDLFLSPPNLETVRRAAAAWTNGRISEAPADVLACIRDHLLPQDFRDAILAVLPPSGSLDGLLAQAIEGLDSHFAEAVRLWRDNFKNFHPKFGPELTHDVYTALLGTPEGEALLAALQQLGHPLRRLADLVADPPDYLLVTRRFRRSARDMAEDETTHLHPTRSAGSSAWNGRFDLARLGQAGWHFFLDDGSTIIVKLGGRRGIAEILAEADAAYRSDDRANPLGLPFEPGSGKTALDLFIADLTDDVRSQDWRGILVIAPALDLNSDAVLRTLCGFNYLSMLWAAVGGKAPQFADGAQPSLDVSGHVRRRETPESEVRKGEKAPDVTWSLTHFDVRVAGSTIESGEIAFLLQLKELLGALRTKHDWEDLEIRATLPPAPPGDGGKPRPFTFAAGFAKPQVFEIDIAFLDELALKSIKVGSNQGDVTLDIDADLVLRDPGFPGFDFPTPKGGLQLRDFRIRMPELPGGESLPMGALRGLRFDLPSVNFPIVAPRQVSLFGLEITPTGLGLLRGDRDKIDADVRARAGWVLEPGLPAGQLTFPYVDVKLDFGALPVFGGGTRLQLDGLLGVAVSDGLAMDTPGFAVSGARGRDIEFALFRLLSLKIEELTIGRYERRSPATGKPAGEVGVLKAENWDLRILKWAFLSSYRKDILLAHDTIEAGRKGLFAMGTRRPDPDAEEGDDDGEAEKGFFRLDWMLLTRNLDIGGDIKAKLLDRSGGNANSVEDELNVIDQVFVEPKDGAKPYLNADFTNGEWLFGLRFRLGELFEYCTLVLHDGHFYGIGLKADWLEPLTGMDELTFAYIPGPSPELDRFRTSFKIAALNLFADMRSGMIALEWSPNWDFLVDLGYPWRGPDGYDWFRAFSMPVGSYEAKFGLFFEKRTLVGGVSTDLPPGRYLVVGGGVGFYLGYYFGGDYGIAWVHAGIGIFGILSGRITLAIAEGGGALAALKGSIAEVQITGAIGIFAYGEGGVEVWILSARFRVSAQASITVTITYRPKQTVYLEWNAELRAAYSASVRVGSGWFSWTFRVSGSCGIGVHGRTALG